MLSQILDVPGAGFGNKNAAKAKRATTRPSEAAQLGALVADGCIRWTGTQGLPTARGPLFAQVLRGNINRQ